MLIILVRFTATQLCNMETKSSINLILINLDLAQIPKFDFTIALVGYTVKPKATV